MGGHKTFGHILTKHRAGICNDIAFGTAHIHDNGFIGNDGFDLFKNLFDRLYRRGYYHQVRTLHRKGSIIKSCIKQSVVDTFVNG